MSALLERDVASCRAPAKGRRIDSIAFIVDPVEALRSEHGSDHYRVGAFEIGRAVGLIALTATLGYVFGRVIGAIWNGLHRG